MRACAVAHALAATFPASELCPAACTAHLDVKQAKFRDSSFQHIGRL